MGARYECFAVRVRLLFLTMSTKTARPEAPKYQIVREQVAAAIRAGQWQSGAQLPSERELATRYGVSYMTARRAVEELIESDLIERRGRNRTFVRPSGDTPPEAGTLNLIWTPSGNETLRTLLRLSQEQAREFGFEPRLICWSSGSKRAALNAISDSCPTLVGLGFKDLNGSLLSAMQGASSRLVLLGNRLDHLGIPSILADDAQGVHLALERLRELGHTNIAFISNRPKDPIEVVRRTTWEDGLKETARPSQLKRWLLQATTPLGEPASETTYRKVRQFLESGHADATALLCTSDQAAIAALAACHDCGWPVPAKISILTFSSSRMLPYLRPSLAAIDVDLELHARLACEALSEPNKAPEKLKLVQPRLVEGQSLGRAPRPIS